jgi:Arc/MetJ-type ribon-helix-helix transcriptional regulator
MSHTERLQAVALRKPPPNAGEEIREPKWRARRNYPMASFSTRLEVQSQLARLKAMTEDGLWPGASKSFSSIIREAVVRLGERPEEEIVGLVQAEGERRGDGSVQQNRYPYITTPDHQQRLRWLKQYAGARSQSEVLRAALMALEAPDRTRRF